MVHMQMQSETLWRHKDFLKVWAGQAISLCGSQVTTLALPMTAVLLLHANAAQMGYLQAAEFIPFLLIGLLVGVWIDRMRRRPVMVVADIIRFFLLAAIPVTAFFHVLTMEELYVVAFGVGTLTIFFDVAYRSYLPALVDRDQLVDGNSKLELTSSISQLVGPGLAGMLIQALSAPISILVDAFSFLFSALSLLWVQTVESFVPAKEEKQSLFAAIMPGLRILLGNAYLRPVVISSIHGTLFSSITTTVYLLYATNALHISPALIGIIYTIGGLGAIPGAMMNQWITRRLGIGLTSTISCLLVGCFSLLVPLAGGAQLLVLAVLFFSQFAVGLVSVLWNVNQLSIRQALTPDSLLGRVNGSYRFLVWGITPLGSLIGGACGTLLGLRATLWIGALGCLIAPIWMIFSPLRALKDVPEPVQ